MKKLELTQEQIDVVMQALDAAIRAGGANTAVIVLPVMQEIEKQIKQ